ncbi:hypothetical protein [Janthinobacterium sp. B9-8]|uniref:hypothetical protein n=1 Tax=Janthinobacterium sp. B9-8 TaxID=1236179 RepID=UPI0012E3D577|nr:hypothetical protein [Janthinobacterium sp. B9-8]
MKTFALAGLLMLCLAKISYAGQWQELGSTPEGNLISVLDTQIRKGAIITTRIRNDLSEPKLTENGSITRIEADLQINCSKKTVSPIRTFLFDDKGSAELSVNVRGGRDFIKKNEDSSFGMAIKELC